MKNLTLYHDNAGLRSMRISANLKDIESGMPWRGYVDGILPDGTLHGWALCTHDTGASLKLDLYVHGFHIASTYNSLDRQDVARAIGVETAKNLGFSFKLNVLEKDGSLGLLRKYGTSLLEANLVNDIMVCIGGTQHALPKKNNAGIFLDLKPHLHEMVRASLLKLREEQILGGANYQISRADEHILLMSNPLFSSVWYAETHGEVAITGLEPAEHYLRVGKELERSVGPWFDTQAYLAATPAARDTTLSPIVHYQLHGHPTWWPGQGRFRSASPGRPGEQDHALLIHLSHLDSIPDVQDLVAQFPDDADIFISIPEDSPLHDPKEIAALFPRARKILTVTNQGGNIGAFLETVRRLKGRGYRFFCKAHSQNGNEYPETWRRIGFDALAATPQRVAWIVDLFRKDPRTLVAGPSQFWLNGQDFGQDFGTRLSEAMTNLGFGAGTVSYDWSFFSGSCFWIDTVLAEMIADTISGDQFVEADVKGESQTTPLVERLFCHVAAMAGGRFALVDGCDWTATPVVIENPSESSLRLAAGEDSGRFMVRHLRELASAKILDGTAAKPKLPDSKDIFTAIDFALHGTIDVLISCWNGRPEILHSSLARLGQELEQEGLSWAGLVSSPAVNNVFMSASCKNIVLDTLYLKLPPGYETGDDLDQENPLSDEIASYLLRSEHLFIKQELPTDSALDAAIARIRTLYAYWRMILRRHRVKTFLIWGSTAPKSRMFIRLCQDLEIEYQIIERGHFPGTLSIDPIGQFGHGAYPQLMEHGRTKSGRSAELDKKFDEICTWYETQHANVAYAHFQKRQTRDLDVIRRARKHGRPIILVIGGNDQGAGVTGPGPDPLRVNWFADSDQAFAIIRRMVSAKFPEALLVLRPHPSQGPQDGEFVLIARESALDDLVDNADICITIATTASALCLLKEKPLLTLGLSEMNGQNIGVSIIDETHLLSTLRQYIWSDFADPYPDGANRQFIVDLFDRHLVGIDRSIPTRHTVTDLKRLLAGRIQRMKTGFLLDCIGREEQISRAMLEDVRDRGRAIFPVDRRMFSECDRPRISVVMPIYGDYEGTRICLEQLELHRAKNGYRVIMVWDKGPDPRLRDLCLEFSEKVGFTYRENRENIGFSGTVNRGILDAGRDDVILLNSDTISCDDWALRLQNAAYAHPKIASVVPFSNNASIFNIPFPAGKEMPHENPVEWVEAFDLRARRQMAHAMEVPVSHGFCAYIRRSTFDRIGLYSETKFDKGYGEDNEFSMRIRAAGYLCACANNVFVGHAGSTSFAGEAVGLKESGRKVMQKEFPHYLEEIRHFVNNDPLSLQRYYISE